MSQPKPLKYQLFGQTIDLMTDNDKFYMVDLSDADNIIKRLTFDIIDNEVETGHSVEDLVWDWESDLMNQLLLNDKKKKIRASTRFLTMKKRCCSGDYYHFVWNGVQAFDEKLLCPVPRANEKGAAFVGDGGLLLISTSDPVYIERGKNNSFTKETCSELPSMGYNTKDFCTDIVIPCSNVLERDYSLTAFYSNSNVFLFDLKNDKFSSTPIQFIHPDDLFVFKEAFDKAVILPYLEGNRMRVFVVQKERLLELVWSGEEFKSQLQMVIHLEFVQSIQSISRMDNLGLLVRSKDVNRNVQYHVYEPQSYNPEHCKKEGIWRFISNIGEEYYTKYLYAPKSRSIVKKYRTEYTKYLSFEEMMALPSSRISESFDEESFAKFKEYDASFNVYKPICESAAIKKVSVVKPNQRITEGYQIQLKYIDHIEIVAGIKCKDFADQLGQFISKDYVELSPTDLADYLGAPVVYLSSWGNVLTHEYFLRDMQYGKRTSPILEMSLERGGGSMVDIANIKFLGIVQGKPFDDSSEMNTDEDEETEHQKLFKNNQFIMETKTMVATDPFVAKGGVILNNVRQGIWQWKTTNKSQSYYDGGYLEQNLTAQFVAVHSDYVHLLNDSIWTLPNDREEEFGGKHERNEYFEKKMAGDWFQMKLGVSSDVAVVGLFDEKYFNDEKSLPANKVRRRAILETHFDLCYESPYQEYLTNRMEEDHYASNQMDMPFGIITSSGYGDGYYSVFFKKSEDGEVIAVKIFFV